MFRQGRHLILSLDLRNSVLSLFGCRQPNLFLTHSVSVSSPGLLHALDGQTADVPCIESTYSVRICEICYGKRSECVSTVLRRRSDRWRLHSCHLDDQNISRGHFKPRSGQEPESEIVSYSAQN